MLFTFSWTHTPAARDVTIKQFMATGGMPPAGIDMLSRYHNVDGTAALASWALDWNGLIDIKIVPIMDDETISGVLGPRFA